jgi:glutaredoxin
MRKLVPLFLLILAAAWFYFEGIALLPQPRLKIIIYGTPRCASCKTLTNELSKRGLNYSFRDVSATKQNADEMWAAIRRKNRYAQSVRYPIVVIHDKTVLSNPQPDTVAALAKRPVFSWEAIKSKWFKRQKSATYINP